MTRLCILTRNYIKVDEVGDRTRSTELAVVVGHQGTAFRVRHFNHLGGVHPTSNVGVNLRYLRDQHPTSRLQGLECKEQKVGGPNKNGKRGNGVGVPCRARR